MLTETVVIFSVLLLLMILISIMGGSILPVENFADEVVIDEDGAGSADIMDKHPSELGANKFEGMSVDELKKVASDIAAMKDDEERLKFMDSMTTEVKEVLTIMLKGMGVDIGSNKASKDVSITPEVKQVVESDSAPPPTPPSKEGFSSGMHTMQSTKPKPHVISSNVSQSGGNVNKIEPFDGDQYALY